MPRDFPNTTVEPITTAEGLETYGVLNRLPARQISYQIGIAEAIGHRPTMEDSYGFVHDFDGIRGQGVFVVFDGHGNKLAAEWAGGEFHKHLLQQIHEKPNSPIDPDILTAMFKSMDDALSARSVQSANWAASGCTAAVAFLRIEDPSGHQSFSRTPRKEFLEYYKPNTPKPNTEPPQIPVVIPPPSSLRVLYAANVGDSRIVLCRGGVAERLTYDHKVSDKPEFNRVRGLKGVFWRGRILGQLNVTRSLGDHESQQGYSIKKFVIGTPYMRRIVLDDTDEFCIIACDGLWDVIEDQDAVDCIRDVKDPNVASKMLLDLAMKNETRDNVTVMVVRSSSDIMHQQGKVSVGYFVNWGIYGRKFLPSNIPTQDLTHVLYSFANLQADTGEVILSDAWADKDIHYPGDSWNDEGNNLYGNLKAIYNIKKQNRHLKVLLSIGGWTYSPSFHPVVVDSTRRANFVKSAVAILEDYGLDGLDVDYEYPSNDEQARGYVALLHELRVALDKHAHEKGADYRFLLTIAAPCGPEHYKKLHIAEMNKSLDFWNMMAYDFSGSWDKVANHQANVFGSPINAADAIHHYIAQGVARSKIVMGIPLYGRSFMSTQGPGSPFSGVGGGTWEAGVYDYRALPLPGSHVMRDEKALASWTYNYETKEMVSFDSEEVGKWKGEWIKAEGLAGSMFWELSGDKGGKVREGMEGGPGKDLQPGQSLVGIVKQAMGGLRNGMP
ncbi:hypothetical protein H0H93_003522 [Arthromyces matolae]|nr:hypothetical protein H0H93_003522 [Arthromyces matolae]